ncbi:MAG: Formamidopyrimidine-DNA glycosylase [Cyanobacteriota bacterium]
MPELPEVETVRRGLEQLTSGQCIEGGEVLHDRSLAYPLSAGVFWQQMTGCRFKAWQRRGKYLLAQLEKDQQSAGWLGCHLRMTGQLLWVTTQERRSPHTRIVLRCQAGQELRFVDIRTFGRLWLIPPGIEPAKIMTGLQKLGPEPFAEEFTPDYLYQKLHNSRRPLKTALLDQSLVAGLGNIYADEVLFFSGFHPTTPADCLSQNDCLNLHHQIQHILQLAIASGGTSFKDYRQVTGINGNYGGIAHVYGRRGESCRQCGAVIEKLKLAGRSSHFCPRCQPLNMSP